MHDIRMIRETPEVFDAAMKLRKSDVSSSDVLAIDAARRAKISEAENAKAEQNAASKEVGAAKAKGDEAEFERLRALVGEKKADVARLNEEAKADDAKQVLDLKTIFQNSCAALYDGRRQQLTNKPAFIE